VSLASPSALKQPERKTEHSKPMASLPPTAFQAAPGPAGFIFQKQASAIQIAEPGHLLILPQNERMTRAVLAGASRAENRALEAHRVSTAHSLAGKPGALASLFSIFGTRRPGLQTQRARRDSFATVWPDRLSWPLLCE
jgi:hypothetical protein